ncbi:MAG: hypothetical protein GYB64_18140 [Chloroflexi bacterium]|nr:hypothetical protein [Chloroflexota bacterium]
MRLSQFIKPLIVAAVILAAGSIAPVQAAGFTIDDYGTNQGPIGAIFPTQPLDEGTLVTGVATGGERDLAAAATTGTQGATTGIGVAGGLLRYLQDDPTSTNDSGGFGTVQYDGIDGNGDPYTGLDSDGLGGIDLTSGGAANAFCLDIDEMIQLNVSLAVSTDAESVSSLTTFIDDIESPTTVAFPFVDFFPTGGAGADFSDVGAIVLTLGNPRDESSASINIFRTCTVAAVNIPNGDLDAGGLAPWTDAGTGSLVNAGSQAHTPPTVYRFTGATAGFGTEIIRQVLSQSGSAGDTYYLSFYIYGLDIQEYVQKGVRISFIGATTQNVLCPTSSVDDFNWQRQVCEAEATIPYNQIRIDIGWRGAGSGSMAIDSISMVTLVP